MKKLFLLAALFISFNSLAQKNNEKIINTFMDSWHKAAASADEEVFFGSMTKDGIYLGTDKTEKWTRDEMAVWAKEYFERESAWSFTATSRDIYFSENGKVAWLNEKLDTWMGVCKGTAVLELTNEGWKIALYDLSVTIDNDKIQKFIELIEEK
ncbi:nuclear transport factor 2 family protein [Marivirga arenosa]|uniref:Nuclear transport factor 2 family protein n=1 Tax=Marivirga arenosa TaxID=3059076 RepID=A0AA49J997_9BACT|nr:nuclear transport factor 2 family protein [Marivirga sp. BKB1-2]WKK79979.2 nuclear transport factor 2 family protein [Marivirga sp. BKB1-2]